MTDHDWCAGQIDRLAAERDAARAELEICERASQRNADAHMAELKRRKQAEAKLAEWKHLANHRSPVDLSRLKERIKTLEAELAEVKAERDKTDARREKGRIR